MKFLVGSCHSSDEVFVSVNLYHKGGSLNLCFYSEPRGLDTSNIIFRVREAMESVKELVLGLYHSLPQSVVKD